MNSRQDTICSTRQSRSRLAVTGPGRASRRRFLSSVSALGAAYLSGLQSPALAEPAPETDRIRLVHSPSICMAPQYIAEDLLHREGFAHVEYVSERVPRAALHVADGVADLSMDTAPYLIPLLDAGKPVVAIGGVHAGCYELLAQQRIRAVRDLKGAAIGIGTQGGADHLFLSSILAYVGIDPRSDVRWMVTGETSETLRLFQEGRIDAFLGFPPHPQMLRTQKIGHMLLNIGQDRPWSQYFCCIVTANRDFTQRHPVATKRALRAILKAADVCANEPTRAAQLLVAEGYEPSYTLALEVLKSLPYRRWRESDAEDTLRFYALRLRDVGMIRSTPQKLIAQGTDWRFLNQLKRELKV
jgi:NitT/TauT family transport system substrate-binding protein